MAVRCIAALLSGVAVAHPGGLQCGDERFEVGNSGKCMTLDIVDKQDHPGLGFVASPQSFAPGTNVQLIVDVESPGPYDNSTGQDPYGIYFAILAKGPDASDYGSFTEMPASVSPKDASTCPHQVFAGSDDTTKDAVSLTWTAGPETCGDVSFTLLWGNGPGDPPKAPGAPFLYRSVVTVSGDPCKASKTTSSTAAPAGEQWVCSVCAHVYDPAQDGAGSAFEDLHDDWTCPVCGQPKSAYTKEAGGCIPCSAVPSCTNCCGPCAPATVV